MMTIRREQMRALNAYTRQAFEDRMARHLRQIYPEQVQRMGDPADREPILRAVIRQGIEKAVRYQILAERDVGRFIDLMVKIAPDFAERPDLKWAAGILKDPTLHAHGKVELIHAQLAARTAGAEATAWNGAGI